MQTHTDNKGVWMNKQKIWILI